MLLLFALRLFILSFTSFCSPVVGLSHHLSVLGAHGTITAFARVLVSTPAAAHDFSGSARYWHFSVHRLHPVLKPPTFKGFIPGITFVCAVFLVVELLYDRP